MVGLEQTERRGNGSTLAEIEWQRLPSLTSGIIDSSKIPGGTLVPHFDFVTGALWVLNLGAKKPLFYNDIELAIYGQRRILENTTGREVGRMDKLMSLSRDLSEVLGQEQFTRGTIVATREKVVEVLKSAGLARASEVVNYNLTRRIGSICRSDSGYSLSLNSLIRARAAMTSLVEKGVMGEIVGWEDEVNLGVLMASGEFCKIRLKNATIGLEGIQTVVISEDLRKGRGEELKAAVSRMASLCLVRVRLAPYLLPARIGAIMLVGCREEKKDLNRKVLGKGVAEELFGLLPVTRLIEGAEWEKACRQIGWTLTPMREVLKEYAGIGKK